MHEDNAELVELLELNRDLQGSRAVRLLTTTNLSLYATLMERHLSDGAVPETELVVRLERDLEDLDDAFPQPPEAPLSSFKPLPNVVTRHAFSTELPANAPR